MFIDYKAINHPIETYELNEEGDILLFKTSFCKYQYRAEGDCCSFSKFFKYKDDFSKVIGNVIKSVKEIDIPDDFEHEDYEKDNDDNCCIPYLYQMKFKNTDETFEFLMFHYSNGYYSGWITSALII